jgi:2-oxoglutarate ferredoxin oxidoreductase subunit alpha
VRARVRAIRNAVAVDVEITAELLARLEVAAGHDLAAIEAARVVPLQRLLRKFETARELLPPPVVEKAKEPTRAGVIWFGSTGAAMAEALAELARMGIHLDRLRLRAFPFADAVGDIVAAHEPGLGVEQNRDAPLRFLFVNECEVDPGKLIPVLHYDGTPITERFITREIAEKARLFNVVPLRQTGAA